jgi:hypothetical protein
MHAKANYKHGILLLLVMLALLPFSHAQDVTATLSPMDKMVQVGRPFKVELLVRHPEDVVVIFPDSIKDIAPYEVRSGKPLATRTNEGISEDVKIYDLYTWEIDSVQFLLFPVRYLTPKGDTLTVLSNRAQVDFQQVIVDYNDSLKVQMYPDAVIIREPFNWSAFLIIAGILLVLIIAAFLLLSKPIRNAMKRRRIEREWRKYQKQLQKVPGLLPDQELYLSELNRVWRAYFDRDWKLALGSRTTQELKKFLPSVHSIAEPDRASLITLASSADLVLYAGRPLPTDQMDDFYQQVTQIMDQEYARRKGAVEV